MGHKSTLTFSECNLTTISSTVSGAWAEQSSPFSTFEGDHTATVILDNSVARFTHPEADILNRKGSSILAEGAASPDIDQAYTSGTGAWAATVAAASSSARTLDIQFGRSSSPGVQQIFRNTVVWCAATWGASAQLVTALETLGEPTPDGAGTDAAACTECCAKEARQGLGRGRTVGLSSLQPAAAPAFAAVPVDFSDGFEGESPNSQTPSQQSGSSSVPRLVLIVPLGIAAIALGILLVVILRPLAARLRSRRRRGEYGIDMVTSGAAASGSSADGKAAEASPSLPGRPHATRHNSCQNSIFLDSFASASEAPPPPTDVGNTDEDSSGQGVESFKVYENSSFSPTR